MDLKKLNKMLEDLDTLRSNRKNRVGIQIVKKIDTEYGEGEQGAEGLSYETYQVEDMYIRLKITTDSYGSNESISGIQFVKPTKKEIISYEPV